MFEIPGIRPSVISEPTYLMLSEILRFRHFRRYYFDFDYDWDRLALVEKKYTDVFSLLQKDLSRFEHFLRELIVTFAQEQPHTAS